MGNISLIFSLVFFTSIFIYLYFGIYIIKLNSKANINKVFLAFCISMSIWCFGFGMANLSKTIESVLFWRRISAIGWTTIYSCMLHFFILLSHKNTTLKVQRSFMALYVPAIINMYIFSFSNKLAAIQYNLIKIDYGWINISVNNGWDWFFRSYYISYVFISMLAIWKWQNDLKDRNISNQARVIIGLLISVSILGTITDIASSSMGIGPFPQMAPIFILLATWAMYHSVKYHGVISFENGRKAELIINEEDKKKMSYYISTIFFISGMVNFLFEYTKYINNSEYNLKLGIIKGFMFLITGGIIHLIQNIKDKSLREFFTILILIINIPIITLNFLEYASITVWVFPMIIVIASLIFSKRSLLVSATIVGIITQIIVWILRPELTVVVNYFDYLLRIGLFLTAFIVGTYVNNIYIEKIKENEYQIKFKNMHSAVSSDFVTINQKNSDVKINNLLSELGSFFEADRTYFCGANYENDAVIYSHEWCNEGIDKRLNTMEELKLTKFPWWIKELTTNKFIYIKDVSKMPDIAISEKKQLTGLNVKSIIAVPIEGSHGMQGFIGIEKVVSLKQWINEDIELLKILSNLLADALIKIKSEKEINFMAYYDNLTHLPNRFLFNDRVNQCIQLAKRQEAFVSVIFLDLDNFKSVNDTIGHKGGDHLLKEVARSLENIVRKTDTVSRFGGDEFMIMLNNINDQNNISNIADKIMALFQDTFNIEGREFKITASAGISIYPVDGEDAETLIKNADTAMYKAKEKGKNQYALCNLGMKEEVKMSMTLSNDLYRALERDEFEVYYQPQIELSNGTINGLEALLRWKHPERGMIPPITFIPIAEKNGTISKIGEWVLRTACAQNKKWQDMGFPHLLMGVNLSAIQFIDPNITDSITNILDETGLESKYLELEITESMAIRELSYAEDILNKLKSIGIRIAIDDFGTEYSSLSRLKMLPIDRIKIDMQFIQGIELSEKDQAITMIIINLAKSLGLNVLAEGVETGPQLDFLNQKMCDDVQGYYYYKPMPAKEVEKILLSICKEKTVELNNKMTLQTI